MREESVLPALIIALVGLGSLLVCLGASGWASGADDEPPVAVAGDDFDAFVGDKVIFNGSASTDNGVATSYEWAFKDGAGDIKLVGMVVTYVFSYPGTYTVTLTVSDQAGNEDTDTLRAVLRYNDTTPPVANAGENQTVDQGTTVTLDGTASTDNVGVVGYSWAFNDGGTPVTLQGSVVQHRFDLPGTYVVTLNASDALGNWLKDTVTITVNALERDWALGPFIDDEGLPIADVDVVVVLNGTRHTGIVDKDGYFQAIVKVDDLVSPAKVTATKDGWKDLSFDMPLGANGNPSGNIPGMEREEEEGGTGFAFWIGLVIVIVLVAVVFPWYRKR